MSAPAANEDRAALAAAAGPVPLGTRAILRYDTRRFPFAALLSRDVYKVSRLDLLHEYVRADRLKRGLGDTLAQEDNLLIRKMMQDLPDDAPLYKLYRHFMLKVLSPLVGRSLSYSSHPKMRVHFPGTPSVSSVHHDIIVTKRADQVNFWMPFTDVDDGATLWLESTYGRGDLSPVPVRYGEVLIFDGGYLGHASVPNRTNTTRLSLDMRFSFKGAKTRADGVDLMNRIVARLGAEAAGSGG